MTKFVTLSIERLNQVIEALNSYCNTGEIDCADDLVAELLAERDQKQDEQEPMAWIESRWLRCLLGPRATWAAVWNTRRDPELIPLYTHPHQRSPLTDEQIFALFESVWTDGTQTGPVPPMAIRLSRAIEAAHNIK